MATATKQSSSRGIPANGKTSGKPTQIRISPRIQSFLKSAKKNFIGGQWMPAASGRTLEVFNPATGEPITHCAAGDVEDINRAVSAARKAFESGPWRRMTPSERGRLIWRIGDLILQNADELAELESLDNG